MAKIPYALDGKPHKKGGYATVWRGVHRETGEVVAVKRPHAGEEARARFEREVEVQTALDHPNVMPVVAASIEGRTPWLAMPFADRNLTEAIEKDKDVSPFQLLRVAKGFAQGIEHAHRQGLVHRDLNPNNVMELRDPSSRWVVGDWGLVGQPHRASSPRMTSQALGTEGFIAPELLREPLTIDPKSDVYSIGRIVHFAVTTVWPRYVFPLPNIRGTLWAEFVADACREDPTQRPTVARLIQMISALESRVRMMETFADDLLCPRCAIPISGARCESCGLMWD